MCVTIKKKPLYKLFKLSRIVYPMQKENIILLNSRENYLEIAFNGVNYGVDSPAFSALLPVIITEASGFYFEFKEEIEELFEIEPVIEMIKFLSIKPMSISELCDITCEDYQTIRMNITKLRALKVVVRNSKDKGNIRGRIKFKKNIPFALHPNVKFSPAYKIKEKINKILEQEYDYFRESYERGVDYVMANYVLKTQNKE